MSDHVIEVRPLASMEIIEAYSWYEEQREGLGYEFLMALDLFYDKLLLNPLTHSFYEENVRQGKLDKFPFVVVYEVFNNTIVVYSVFMEKQNPSKKRTK